MRLSCSLGGPAWVLVGAACLMWVAGQQVHRCTRETSGGLPGVEDDCAHVCVLCVA